MFRGQVVAYEDDRAVLEFPEANWGADVTLLVSSLIAGEWADSSAFTRCRLVSGRMAGRILPGSGTHSARPGARRRHREAVARADAERGGDDCGLTGRRRRRSRQGRRATRQSGVVSARGTGPCSRGGNPRERALRGQRHGAARLARRASGARGGARGDRRDGECFRAGARLAPCFTRAGAGRADLRPPRRRCAVGAERQRSVWRRT